MRTKSDVAAVVFAMLFPTVGTWLYFVALAGHEWMRPAYALCKVVQFAFPLFWVCVVQRQPIRPQLPTRHGLKLAIAFGLLVVAAMLALYHFLLSDSSYLAGAGPAVWRKLEEIGAVTLPRFLIMAVFITLMHSFLEEYYWRWFVFGKLRRDHSADPATQGFALPVLPAAIVSGLAFALHHVIVVAAYIESWAAIAFFSFCVAVGGAMWAWIYHRSRSLYGPWLSHILVDAGLMWMGYHLCRGYFSP